MRHPKDLFDFSGQVALITGSGSGLGMGIALRFAQAGADIVVHYKNSQEGAENVALAIRDIGQRAVVVQADVTNPADVNNLIYQAVDQLGQLTVLINNAGAYPQNTLLNMPTDEWQHVIDANLKSVFLCTQAAARQMQAQSDEAFNAIINISSIEGLQPAAAHGHYAASKAGVLMHTRASAQELGPYGIRVNAVSPGLIDREGLEEAWPEGVERWHRVVPLGRMGDPEDVADACLFLASPAARWITGANLVVDGGVTSQPIF